MTAPDLATFLTARLDEDEQLALNAAGDHPGHWAYDPNSFAVLTSWQEVKIGSDADGLHIARQDPAQVLADIDAKRRIIESYTKLREADEDLEHLTARNLHQMQTLGWVLRMLALPYRDHEGFDPSWTI